MSEVLDICEKLSGRFCAAFPIGHGALYAVSSDLGFMLWKC